MEPAVQAFFEANLQRLSAPVEDVDAYARVLKQTLCMGPNVTVSDWDLEAAVAGTPLARLIADLKAAGRPRQAASIAHFLLSDARPQIARRFVRLYVRGDAGARRVMQQLLFDCDPNDTIPYLFVLLLMIGHEVLGDPRVDALLGGDNYPGWNDVVRRIVNDPRTHDFLRMRTQTLRFYSGGANTVLGLYDGHFDEHFARHFNLDAAFLGDLGGGFATADLNRVTGRRFTSVDIRSPDPYEADPLYLPLRKWVAGRGRMLDAGERRAYLEAQRQVAWIRWDVIERRRFIHLLGDHPSYGFTSTGFLTSTVQPVTSAGTLHGGANFHGTTFLTLKRILELVQRGKDVSLFTVARPSNRPFYFKSCLLRWQDRRLVASRFVDLPIARVWSDDRRGRIIRFVLAQGAPTLSPATPA